MKKICSKCGIGKPLDEFYYSIKLTTKDKRRPECKECGNKQRQRWREENPEKYEEQKKKIREWKSLNRDKCNKYTRDQYKRNPEKVKETIRRWQTNHPDKVREMQRELYRKNADKINKRRSILHKENPQYYINRNLKITEKGRLNARMSASIRQSLRGNKGGWHWEKLVGYTVDDLKRHLEKQFQSGMSWKNMGEWHIDHITPVSIFNFETHNHIDFQRCWALKNLRPLWAKENRRKNNKFSYPFQPALAF